MRDTRQIASGVLHGKGKERSFIERFLRAPGNLEGERGC
jgi:hypothetical protein